MNRSSRMLAALFLAASPAISYFQFERPVSSPAQGGQHYAVVDESVWRHALPGLQDLRLYSADREIPYTTRTMRGSRETEQKSVRVLQPGLLGGKTQFLLDMAEIAEYDRVVLSLKTKNYVAHARVEGQDDRHGKQWVDLGTTTLFDLSDERLGRNSTLRLPVGTYRYLRVTIDGLVKPADVESASAGVQRAQEAVWRDLASEPRQTQEGHDTVLIFSVAQNTPVERATLAVDPAQGNFERAVEVQDERGTTEAVGQISRIHMQRNGGRIDFEETMLFLSAAGRGQMRIVIHNGDDAPLKITGARLQQYERRIYFDCDAGTRLGLYYGDSKLAAPVYDYAKLFQLDANAARVDLGSEAANSGHTGRPDERPWSERHPALLWAAILAAVAILGGIALRSIKASAA